MCGAGSRGPLRDNASNTTKMLAQSGLLADATIHFEHFHKQTEVNKTLYDGASEQIPEWQHRLLYQRSVQSITRQAYDIWKW